MHDLQRYARYILQAPDEFFFPRVNIFKRISFYSYIQRIHMYIAVHRKNQVCFPDG